MEIDTYISRLKEMADLNCSISFSFICPGYKDLNRFNGTMDKGTCKFCRGLIVRSTDTDCPCDILGDKIARERVIALVKGELENGHNK